MRSVSFISRVWSRPKAEVMSLHWSNISVSSQRAGGGKEGAQTFTPAAARAERDEMMNVYWPLFKEFALCSASWQTMKEPESLFFLFPPSFTVLKCCPLLPSRCWWLWLCVAEHVKKGESQHACAEQGMLRICLLGEAHHALPLSAAEHQRCLFWFVCSADARVQFNHEKNKQGWKPFIPSAWLIKHKAGAEMSGISSADYNRIHYSWSGLNQIVFRRRLEISTRFSRLGRVGTFRIWWWWSLRLGVCLTGYWFVSTPPTFAGAGFFYFSQLTACNKCWKYLICLNRDHPRFTRICSKPENKEQLFDLIIPKECFLFWWDMFFCYD